MNSFMKLITLAVIYFLSVISIQAQNVSGVYTTDFNEMTLQQSGNRVTGTYKHANGRIDGTLNGNTLTGWWYQDNGKGRLVFVFNNDFSAFSGKWSYNDAEPSSGWNGTRAGSSGTVSTSPVYNMPSLSGTYTTDFNDMTLQQSGSKVTGTYKHANGRIEGTLNGNTLTGWWYQDNGKGRLVFVFNSDFSAFSGKWSYNDAEPSSGWNGTRTGSSGNVSNSPVYNMSSLSGTYTTDFNDMTLQQSGSKVTGTYKHANGRIEGTLNGNTLTGWWYQDNGKGRLIFVFNSDFSAFSGKWSYNDAEPSSGWNGTKQ